MFGGVTGVSYIDCNISNQSFPILGNNMIHVLTNNQTYIDQVGLCNVNETYYQKQYQSDFGTIIQGYPNDSAIIKMARDLLSNS